jgi:hypothetical protein
LGVTAIAVKNEDKRVTLFGVNDGWLDKHVATGLAAHIDGVGCGTRRGRSARIESRCGQHLALALKRMKRDGSLFAAATDRDKCT